MDTVQLEKKFEPIVSCRFGSALLLALFGVPLAVHVVASYLP